MGLAPLVLPVLIGALWVVCAFQDLRTRRISLLVLLALTVLALLSRSWPWWLLAAAALFWPWRRRAWILAPIAAATGVITGDSSAAVALGAGAGAWSLGWWGGADAIVLLVLALRHGPNGLIAGGLAALFGALIVILVRRHSLRSLIGTMPSFLRRQSLEAAVPAASETPAAAAMALGGLIIEGVVLCQMFG